ncbi:MAG: HAMP domain-containing sensor histidine kinase [Pseudomonadota bacterium]
MLSERLKKLTHNSTLRLVFSYFVIFLVSSLILLSFLYWSSVDYIYQQLDHHIEYDKNSLQSIYQQEGSSKLAIAIEQRLKQKSYDSLYLLYDPEKQRALAGNLSLDYDFLADGLQLVALDKLSSALHHKHHSARILKTRLSDKLILLNGLDIESTHQQEHKLANSLLSGIAIIVILGAIGGFIISINTIKKVNLINHTMQKIGDGDIEQRIPSRGTDDDFDLLSDNFNHMLDRLQILMQQIQNISTNVAHDLRTPLTRIRNRLESIQEYCDNKTLDEIELAIEDTDNLLATFATILNINKFETGVQKLNIQMISSHKLITDIMDYYEPLAGEKSIQIERSDNNDISFQADQNMLFLALSNLISNAIKYSPEHGLIKISMQVVNIALSKQSKAADFLQISIIDNGPGISQQEKSKVFELFYRCEKHRDHQGNGLGLSLVAAIVHLHKGRIDLYDNQSESGLKVCLLIPLENKT